MLSKKLLCNSRLTECNSVYFWFLFLRLFIYSFFASLCHEMVFYLYFHFRLSHRSNGHPLRSAASLTRALAVHSFYAVINCAPVPEVSTQFIYLLWHDWQLAYTINQSAYKNCKRIPRGERKFAFKCEQSQVNMMKEELT